MRYSLLSRFRGTLLGAALGELLGSSCASRLRAQQPLPNLAAGSWTVEPLPIDTLGWGSFAVQTAERVLSAVVPSLPPFDRPTPARVAIAALPLALFYHEDLLLLEQQLTAALGESAALPALGADSTAAVLAIGTVIALALQERLHPSRLTAQLLSQQTIAQASPLCEQLRQMQQELDRGSFSSLLGTIAVHAADPTATALLPFTLALYCFLDSPEDCGLSLRRLAIGVAQAERSWLLAQLPVAAALCGALSGAYNGVAGIPAAWRAGLRHPIDDPPLARLWGLPTEDRISQLAQQLLAAWSGVYGVPAAASAGLPLPVTAAPRIIRAR